MKTITIRGIASFAWLNTPDTKFNENGLYKTDLIIEEDKAEAISKLLGKFRDEEAARVTKEVLKGKKPKLADLPVKPQEDKETGEPTGKFIVKSKMIASGVSKKTKKPWSRALPLFDAKGNPTTAKIGGGSEIIISVTPEPYYSAKDKEVGVTLRLEGVQVVKLRAFGSKDAAGLGFGQVEDGEDIPADDASTTEDGGSEEEGDYNF